MCDQYLEHQILGAVDSCSNMNSNDQVFSAISNIVYEEHLIYTIWEASFSAF